MSLPGSGSVRRLAARLFPRAIILLYHRVSAQPSDPQCLSVTPKHFVEHMQVLRERCRPLSLQDLCRRRSLNLWLPRTVVITFDDGYFDNFEEARRALEAVDVPAAVFVTSGSVGSTREFWWDELERIFLSTPVLPLRLELSINHRRLSWELAETAQSASWNVLSETPPTPRQHAYLDLMRLLHNLDGESRACVLSELAAWAGVDAIGGRPSFRAVSTEELQALPADGLIEIGAHTVKHPVLAALSPAAQRAEIAGSRAALEEILGRPVLSFSYPFGGRGDYTPETVQLVREAGFTCACSNFTGHVNLLSDPYQLPRFIVRDWDGETFAHKMGEWFGD